MMKLTLLLSTAVIASTGAFTIQTKSACSTAELNNYSRTIKWSPEGGSSMAPIDPSINNVASLTSSPPPSTSTPVGSGGPVRKSYAIGSWKTSSPSGTAGYDDIVAMGSAFENGPTPVSTPAASTPAGSGGPVKKSYAIGSWKTSSPSGTAGYDDIV